METLPLEQLPQIGKARVAKQANGQYVISANHALAMLRLIELQAGLEIKVTAGEQTVLRNWPKRRFTWTIESDDQQHWAEAAVALLQKGPPAPRRRWPWILGVAAILVYLLTYFVLDYLQLKVQ